MHMHSLEERMSPIRQQQEESQPLAPPTSIAPWQPRQEARPQPATSHRRLPAAWPAPSRRAWSCECTGLTCGFGGSSQEARGSLYSRYSAPTWSLAHAELLNRAHTHGGLGNERMGEQQGAEGPIVRQESRDQKPGT